MLSVTMATTAVEFVEVNTQSPLVKNEAGNPSEDDESTDVDDLREFQLTAVMEEKGKQASLRKRAWKYWKYVVLYLYYILTKSLSLVDLITDLLLLRKAARLEYIALTMALFLSILAPYIISYSSGIKLFLFRRTFDAFRGFEKWGMVLFVLPTGILYFVLLDLIDIGFQLYRLVGYVLLRKGADDLESAEETLAAQLGMSMMNYEGVKRQRTVAQLFFETIPQCTVQTLLFLSMLPGSETSQITDRELMVSIGAALVNSLGQTVRLYFESRAVDEKLLEYALNCIVGRVGWVPFLKELPSLKAVDYNIEYRIPLVTRSESNIPFSESNIPFLVCFRF